MKTRALGLTSVALLVTVAGMVRADWIQWGGTPERNMVADAIGLPAAFQPGREATDAEPAVPAVNIKWAAKLGSETYGNPTVAQGRVFVGTNNASPRNPARKGDRAVVMCFRESDGEFLWQLTVPRIPEGGQFNGDYANLAICSSPLVLDDRVYVVTNRCEVVCLDVDGLADGNDGPFTDEAAYCAKPQTHKIREVNARPQIEFVPGPPEQLVPTDADIIWVFDMIKEVGSWPQDGCSCSILARDNYLYVGTSNAVDKSHKHIPSPSAPSLIVLDRTTGNLVATDDACISPHVLHGQWSSPSLGVVNGRALVFYGGGDGFGYAFDADPVPSVDGQPGILRKVWWMDCNPPEYRQRDGKVLPYAQKGEGPSEVIATPVFWRDRVYVAVGQDPRHGRGKGCLTCIDATRTGDLGESGALWRCKQVARSLSTVSISDGLLYVADYSGFLRCLDAETGAVLWTHDTGARIWGSTLVADDKVYLGTEAGDIWVLHAGPERKVLSKATMDSPVYTTPIVANGVLYVTSQKWLYAVKG